MSVQASPRRRRRAARAAVAGRNFSPSAVEKYVTNIFAKLDLPAAGTDHRRVLAVLKYLGP
jgi:hypothetical protein